MLALPDPHAFWWRFFASARRAGHRLADAYGDASHEIIVQLSRGYSRGDFEEMIRCRELLAASRRWCEQEPLRSKYELVVCRAAFYFTLWDLDNFVFDNCVQRFRMVDQLIEEKRERRTSLGLPTTPESYMRLDILMAKADAKWKAPMAVGIELPSVEVLCDELFELHARILAATAHPPEADLQEGFANIALSLLLALHRYEPADPESRSVRLRSLLWPTSVGVSHPPENEGHWYWRLEAGKAFIDRELSDESIDRLESKVLDTVADIAVGRDLSQYAEGIKREFNWLRKASKLQLV